MAKKYKLSCCGCTLTFSLYDVNVIQTNIFNVASRYPNPNHLPLNPYGNGPFCDFTTKIPTNDLTKNGLYIFVVNGKVMYLGRCLNTYKTAIHNGYGHISPANCYQKGQRTYCHINSEINKLHQGHCNTIEVGICLSENIIKCAEKCFLKCIPSIPWNIQH